MSRQRVYLEIDCKKLLIENASAHLNPQSKVINVSFLELRQVRYLKTGHSQLNFKLAKIYFVTLNDQPFMLAVQLQIKKH